MNKTTGKKVIIVVPTSFLHLYQESHYCPTASKIPDDINNINVADIFYCSFATFFSLEFVVLANAIVLIDEFHELFFNYPLRMIEGKLISVVQLLMSASKVVGVSATFRSDAGVKKIKTILPDTLLIAAPGEFREKELQL